MTNPIHEIAKDPTTPGASLWAIFRDTVRQHPDRYKKLPVDYSVYDPNDCYIASISQNPNLPTDLLLVVFCYYPRLVIQNQAFSIFYKLEDPGMSRLMNAVQATSPVFSVIEAMCIDPVLREEFADILCAHKEPKFRALFAAYTNDVEKLNTLSNDPNLNVAIMAKGVLSGLMECPPIAQNRP